MIQLLAAAIGLLVLFAASPWLSRAQYYYNAVFAQTPDETRALATPEPGSSCGEAEHSWCTMVDYYAKHPDAPPVEIVFGNPRTWFDHVRIHFIAAHTRTTWCGFPGLIEIPSRNRQVTGLQLAH